MRESGKIVFILSVLVHKIIANNLELLILHNNDMHARFEENSDTLRREKAGGFGRTLHVIKEAREAAKQGQGPSVLYLNAGDTYTGTAWFSVYKWKITVEFMNLLHPDVMCLGNHEFDRSIDGLVPFVNASNFPLVAANLDFSHEPALQNTKIRPSVILDVKGRKVGVIGYLTPDTQIMSVTGNVIFDDEVEAVRKESEKLDNMGVNIIIALGHSGYLMDKKIALKVPLVDLVVGGHTNTFLWNGAKPDKEEPEDVYPTVVVQRSGKKVPVVQAYAYTKYMGKLRTVFDDNGNLKSFKGQPIFLNDKIPQDPAALELLNKFRPAIEKLYTEVVGKSYVYLGGDDCRLGECNLGNLVVDSFVDYKASLYKGHFWTDAPIAVMNSGAVRGSIDTKVHDGTITRGDVLGTIPFEQQLITVKMSGKDLLHTLEIGARSNGETSRGEFLQVSGLHVIYDFLRPVGQRVVEVKVLCGNCTVPAYEKLEIEKYYGVIVTNFLINGGDGHVIIRDNRNGSVVENVNDNEALQRYISIKQGIHPKKDERIIILKSSSHSPSNKPSLIRYISTLLCIYLLRP